MANDAETRLELGIAYDRIAKLDSRVDELSDEVAATAIALEDMVRQYAGWDARVGGYSTVCMSALEDAFDVLGWDDPHVDEDAQCDEPGCLRQASCGWPVNADTYRTTCGEHYRDARESEITTEPSGPLPSRSDARAATQQEHTDG